MKGRVTPESRLWWGGLKVVMKRCCMMVTNSRKEVN